MRLICLLLTLLWVTPAKAAPLPDGEYILAGALTPLVQDGLIVPIYVHLKTGGDRMDWTFVTIFEPDPDMCSRTGKCQRRLQTLSHRVAWGDDGGLTVLETLQAQGDGLVIDRADIDPAIYEMINSLTNGGVLMLDAKGGALTKIPRRGKPRKVTLYAGDLELLDQALVVGIGFGMSLARLNQCVFRQVLTLANQANTTSAEQSVLDATAYMLFDHRLGQASEQISWKYMDDMRAPEPARAALRAAVSSMAVALPARDVAAAITDGHELDDDAIISLAREAVEALQTPENSEVFEDISKAIFEDRRTTFLAAVRYDARYDRLESEGYDMRATLCRDVTMAIP